MWQCDCGVPNPDTARTCVRCRLDRAARKQFVGPVVDVAANVPFARAISRPTVVATETPNPARPSRLRRLLQRRETPNSRPDPGQPMPEPSAPTDPAAPPAPATDSARGPAEGAIGQPGDRATRRSGNSGPAAESPDCRTAGGPSPPSADAAGSPDADPAPFAPTPDGLPDIPPYSSSETPPDSDPLPRLLAPVIAAPPLAEGADPPPAPHPYDEIARELRRAILGK